MGIFPAVRETFLAAVEALHELNDGEPLGRVEYEISYRSRRISVAQACGLVWGCTDILPGQVDADINEILEPRSLGTGTYAAAARALLDYLKGTPSGVNAEVDAQLTRLYDRRDKCMERLEIMLGVKLLGAPPAAWSQIERMSIRNKATQALEAWEERDCPGAARHRPRPPRARSKKGCRLSLSSAS